MVCVFMFFNKTLTQSSACSYENILVLNTFLDFTAHKRASVALLDSKDTGKGSECVSALPCCSRVKCVRSTVDYFVSSYESSEIFGPRKRWSILTASKL